MKWVIHRKGFLFFFLTFLKSRKVNCMRFGSAPRSGAGPKPGNFICCLIPFPSPLICLIKLDKAIVHGKTTLIRQSISLAPTAHAVGGQGTAIHFFYSLLIMMTIHQLIVIDSISQRSMRFT